jgi:uncharacterized protein
MPSLVQRDLAPVLLQRAAQYPVITLTGPRQSGKTTLCRTSFAHLPYANLEQPQTHEFAQSDPRAFLAQYPQGAILDEIQRVPELLSSIQVLVDEQRHRALVQGRAAPSLFVLTGGQQLELMASVTQSLAGRTALLQLLPLSINEIRRAGFQSSTARLLHAGGYPAVHAQHIPPETALSDYFATYVERDVRQLAELRNLSEFRRFVRLCAGRVGQLLNLQSLGNDVGVSQNTAKHWLSLLQTSYVVYLLPPWFENLGKRLIKAPKLYFYDVGLAAWLMGITQSEQLDAHPLRGHLFENLVVMEFVKQFEHAGARARLHFFRDSNGVEVDLLVENSMQPGALGLVEIKSAQTYHSSFATNLHRVGALLGARVARKMLVYGGDEAYTREGVEVVGLQARR